MQSLKNGRARTRKRLFIAMQLESPVRAKLKSIELKGELRGINISVKLPGLLRFLNSAPESREPLLHDFRDAVAHRTRTTIELRGGGGEEAAAAKRPALDIAEPLVAEIPEARESVRGLKRRADHFAYKDGASGLNTRHLQILFRAEVSEQPALAHA